MGRFRVRLRTLVAVVALFAVASGIVAWRMREARRERIRQVARQHAAARLKGARTLWDIRFAYFQNGSVLIDDVYRASIWWMEAERDSGVDRSARLGALTAHLDRMRSLRTHVERSSAIYGQDRPPNPEAADYYLSEAEFWLAQAEADG